jgi:hypothetical protein
VETLSYYSRDRIEIGWNMLGIGYGGQDGYVDLLRLWDSCKGGTSFTFYRHVSLGTAYPGDLPYDAHPNVWTVIFDPKVEAFEAYEHENNLHNRFKVTLRMQEVIG